MTATATATSAGAEVPAHGLVWFAAYGVVLLALGVLTLVWPFGGAVALGYFTGWTLCIAGTLGIVTGFGARRMRGHWADALLGLLGLAVGLFVLLDPLLGDLALLWALALRFAGAGVLEIAMVWRVRADRVLLGVLGSVDLALACLLFAGVLRGDVMLAAVVLGVGFLAAGIAVLASALRLRGLGAA